MNFKIAVFLSTVEDFNLDTLANASRIKPKSSSRTSSHYVAVMLCLLRLISF